MKGSELPDLTKETHPHWRGDGFHPNGGWSHAMEGPLILNSPESRKDIRPGDCRTLQAMLEFSWSSDAVKEFLSEIGVLHSAHGRIVEQVNRDADRLRSQDLASAKLPNPLRKLQDRLRIANACLAYHEALLPYLEALLPEAAARHQDAMREVAPIRARIDQGLLELGFVPHLDPQIYTRNHFLIDARNQAAFAGNVADQILEARRLCRERIEAARGEVAFVEREIRSAVS